MDNTIITRRLLIIKHLFQSGIEQAGLPDTVSYQAILSLHDSIDMFMNLAAEKKGLLKGKFLMEYFDAVPELTMRSSVDKINKRRNSLKHHFMIPGKIEIEDSCTVARIFFSENTQIIFNLDFDQISFADLISNCTVNSFLKEAEQLLRQKELKPASIAVAKAFFHLLVIEESHHRAEDRNPFYGPNPAPMLREGRFYVKAMEKFFEGQEDFLKEPKTADGYVEVSEGVAVISRRYNEAFAYVFQSLRILALGLDFKKYNYYKSFMPQAISLNTNTNEYQIATPLNFLRNGDKIPDESDIRFAIDFVMDFALRIQQFKY